MRGNEPLQFRRTMEKYGILERHSSEGYWQALDRGASLIQPIVVATSSIEGNESKTQSNVFPYKPQNSDSVALTIATYRDRRSHAGNCLTIFSNFSRFTP